MNKFSIIFTLFLIVNQVFSQSEPEKPIFDNVVYQVGDSIFFQKSLPVYVSISTGEGGKSYNLKSTMNPSDANPFYFDTEGQNFIRSKWAIDPITKKYTSPKREILMPVYADGIAPRTRLRFSNAPRYIINGIINYGVGLSFTLISKDRVSGVKNTYHALNGDYLKYSTDNLAVTKEGENSIFYFSVDNVGNTEMTKLSKFVLDVTAPVTTYQEKKGTVFEMTLDNGEKTIHGKKSQVILTSKDNITGVQKTEYSIDGGTIKRYLGGNPLNYNDLSDGKHTLSYYSTDYVKNRENKKTKTIILDKTPPVSDLTLDGDQHTNNYEYVSDRTKIKISSVDNKVGVKTTNYDVDGGINNKVYIGPFSLSGKSTLREIRYNSEDHLENIEILKIKTVFLDTDLPSTKIRYGKPLFFSRDTIFITSKTPVKLIANDKHSGVKHTNYRINKGQTSTYKTPFFVLDEGNTVIGFNSTDNVNNKEIQQSSRSFVDNTPPKIYLNFGQNKIGKEEGLDVYPNYVRMFIGATDSHTGTDKILYQINGGDQVEYSSPKTIDISEKGAFSESKKYTVNVEVKDKLGNSSSKTYEFMVKN
tara:strand:+ start:340 stop:2100 length:1761 start_codon:yes stop_codon:yes gene_type:complete